MSGAEIQAEIAAALADVGDATGSGPVLLTFSRVTEEDPENPRTPWEGDNEQPETYTLLVMQERFTVHEISAGSVLATDRKYMAEAGGAVPGVGDGVTVDSARYYLHRVEPEAPGGVALYHMLHLRR